MTHMHKIVKIIKALYGGKYNTHRIVLGLIFYWAALLFGIFELTKIIDPLCALIGMLFFGILGFILLPIAFLPVEWDEKNARGDIKHDKKNIQTILWCLSKMQ